MNPPSVKTVGSFHKDIEITTVSHNGARKPQALEKYKIYISATYNGVYIVKLLVGKRLIYLMMRGCLLTGANLENVQYTSVAQHQT